MVQLLTLAGILARRISALLVGEVVVIITWGAILELLLFRAKLRSGKEEDCG